jgi:hypothetical protein
VTKLLTILSACVVVAAGGAYALYSSRNECSRCHQAQMSCCSQVTEFDASVSDESTLPMAVAGPAALFGTVQVKAELGASCSAAKAQSYNCCESPLTGEPGLEAVTGSAVTLAKK